MWKKFRKRYKLFLTFIVFGMGLFLATNRSLAATYTQTFPQRTITFELLDPNSNPYLGDFDIKSTILHSTGIPNYNNLNGEITMVYGTNSGNSVINSTPLGGNKYSFVIPSQTLSIPDAPVYTKIGPNYVPTNYSPEANRGISSVLLSSTNSLKNVRGFTATGVLRSEYKSHVGNGVGISYGAHDLRFVRLTSTENSKFVANYSGWTSTGLPGPTGSHVFPLGYSQVYCDIQPKPNTAQYHSVGWMTRMVGLNGDNVKLTAQYQQITEHFENDNKATIVAPSGFTQDKKIDMTSSDFTYTMENADKLPKFYTNAAGNVGYTYKGWYRGKTKPTDLNETYPPSISFEADGIDENDTVHIVYSQSYTANLTEQFRDRNGAVIEASWDQASRKVPVGEYKSTPDATKTDTQGRKWEYVGWRVGTTGEIKTTPVSQNLAANSNTTIQYIYQEPKTTGDLSLTIEPEVINNEGDTTLVAILKNTGTSDMKELKMKFSDKWMLTNGSTSGIYSPSSIFVTVEGEAEKKIGTNESNFFNGQPLTDIVIPAGKEARIEIPIRGRGNPLEMLQAGIEISGNLVDDVGNDITLKASNVVRVDDPEAPTIDGDGDAGFINIFKNLNFGTTTYSPSAQTKVLDMTSSPYLRFYDMNDLQPQWSLQAKLDAFKTTANKTLPTATSISFKEFQLYDINDYKKITENISANGAAVSEFVLPSDGNTVEVTNRGNKGYYEIKTGPSNVQLNIPAFAGLSGESYSSTLTWTLSTGP